jgi:asparagine synthase (glutamine-hydrolysing)
MCGIAGIVRRDRAPIADAARVADALGRALSHRGPDGSGWWVSEAGDALLVHRRLAIIDPSDAGAQPMATADGRHRIVFNGEVYNFRELRREYEARGERFATSSDTEVLLRLLARDGPAALERVRGMFALAWWNAVDRSLLVARDRFGMKPLYVAASGAQVAFASEIGALGAARLRALRPSPSGIAAYLAWGSVPPPLTWTRDVDMLPAGTWRQWRRDGIERGGVFADVRDAYRSDRAPALSGREWREAVGAAVGDSVRAHLVADVPVGVFLSGGIDSGAIVSAAVSAGAADLQTFTVGFDDAASETARARSVAARFGTRHHDLHVDASHVAADLPHILARLDQPTIDAVNSYYVARAVASTGIKAVLSGTGGDEIFGGYPTFARLPRAVAAKRMAGPAWPLVASVGGWLMPARLRARWRHFAGANGSLVEAYRVQRGFLLPEEIDDIAGPALRPAKVWHDALDELRTVERLLLEPSGPETPRAAVARLESRLYLQSQLLRDVDAMAMAHGLEVRLPYVDHVLLSAVWPELGRHPGLMRGKALLHGTLAQPLPPEVVAHPKQGFTLPFARWMRSDLAPLVRDGMQQLAAAGWIAAEAPERVWAEWQAGRVHWSRPWGLGVLGHFLAAA